MRTNVALAMADAPPGLAGELAEPPQTSSSASRDAQGSQAVAWNAAADLLIGNPNGNGPPAGNFSEGAPAGASASQGAPDARCSLGGLPGGVPPQASAGAAPSSPQVRITQLAARSDELELLRCGATTRRPA